MPEAMEFRTERLCLRQWREDDLEPFAALNADPRVMEFFPATLDRAASDAMAERCRSLVAERGWGFWAVELRATGEFIGFVGLNEPEAALPVAPCVEIGWRLAFPHWGQGYASEAARGALRVGFEDLGLAEVIAFTAVGNHRSRAVMERLGMEQDAVGFAHPRLPADSPLRAHCVYRLTRKQWRASPTAVGGTPPSG